MITLAAVRRALRGHWGTPAVAPDARPAAVALVLVEAENGAEVLLIRRAVRPGDPWSGQVALPGGRREPGDRDLLATAIRETREETGVDLRRGEPLAVLDDLAPLTRVLPPVVVRPFVFALSRRPALRPNDEVQHAFWVPLDRFAEPGLRREVTLNVRGEERTLPAYVVGEDVIWGMTERILTPFLELVGRPR